MVIWCPIWSHGILLPGVSADFSCRLPGGIAPCTRPPANAAAAAEASDHQSSRFDVLSPSPSPGPGLVEFDLLLQCLLPLLIASPQPCEARIDVTHSEPNSSDCPPIYNIYMFDVFSHHPSLYRNESRSSFPRHGQMPDTPRQPRVPLVDTNNVL